MKDFPLYRSLRSVWVSAVVIGLPLFLLSRSTLGAFYVVILVLYLLPTAVCMAGLIGGALPMALGAAAGLGSMYLAAGATGLAMTAVYLLPIVAAFVFIIKKRISFWQGCGGMILVHLLSLAAVFLLMQRQTGGSLYQAAGTAAAEALDQWELGSAMLYQLYSMGLIALPESLESGMLQPSLFGGAVLSGAARQDMLLSVQALVSTLLSQAIPSTLVSQSILGGVACLLLPLRFGYLAAEKRAYLAPDDAGTVRDETGKGKVDFPDLGMPPLRTWHLPRGIGAQVGIALILGYLLRRSNAPAVSVAGAILYAAATAVFTLQGAALINFMQKARSTKRFWRVLVPVVLLAFSVLSFMGIFDQISNVRGLRKPPETKEDL